MGMKFSFFFGKSQVFHLFFQAGLKDFQALLFFNAQPENSWVSLIRREVSCSYDLHGESP